MANDSWLAVNLDNRELVISASGESEREVIDGAGKIYSNNEPLFTFSSGEPSKKFQERIRYFLADNDIVGAEASARIKDMLKDLEELVNE